MIFEETYLEGAYVISIEPHTDDRGFFARTFCREEFTHHGLVSDFRQMSVARNTKKGQIRGMHYQAAPHEETKIIRCTKGAVIDAIIDIRPDSPTFQQTFSVTLAEQNHKMLYVPGGFAHGYKTLQEDTELFYMMDVNYHPESAREIDWRSYDLFL